MHLLNTSNSFISFKNRYDKYFDNVEKIDTYAIIPEYEDIEVEQQNKDTSSDFFREAELYDRRRDYPTKGYRIYDYDDVELAENMKYRSVPKNILNISRYQENRDFISHPSCIYVPAKPEFYTVDNAWDKAKESFQSRLSQGFKHSDISNIYHFSLIKVDDEGNKKMNLKLADRGFELLKSGRGIYEVAGLMDKSKLSYSDGSQRYSSELLDFLTVYPEARECVVENNRGYESLKKDVMDFYPQISKVCSEGRDINRIVSACQINSKVDENLVSLCLDTIENGESVQNASGCIKKAILRDRYDKNEVFDKKLYKFLLKHPKSRPYVVRKDTGKEYFDTDMAMDYVLIEKLSKRKEDVNKIMDTCMVNGRNYSMVADSELVDLAKTLLKKNSKWSPKHEKIMSSVVKETRYGTKSKNNSKFELANAMAKGKYDIPAIYSVIVLNMKNVELLD